MVGVPRVGGRRGTRVLLLDTHALACVVHGATATATALSAARYLTQHPAGRQVPLPPHHRHRTRPRGGDACARGLAPSRAAARPGGSSCPRRTGARTRMGDPRPGAAVPPARPAVLPLSRPAAAAPTSCALPTTPRTKATDEKVVLAPVLAANVCVVAKRAGRCAFGGGARRYQRRHTIQGALITF
jgi:hypothetical protein